MRLAWCVLLGRVPGQQQALRGWDPTKEVPIAVSVSDWTTGRTIAVLLIPPPFEGARYKYRDHRERTEQVVSTFLDGCEVGDRIWSTAVLREPVQWDPGGECWVVGTDREEAFRLKIS